MAHFEDCKFFLRGTCANGFHCGFRHNEIAASTQRICTSWATGYVCDGRCNLRHPSAAELAAPPPVYGTPRPRVHSPTTATIPPPCKFHMQGRCTKGEACPFFHDPRIEQKGPAPSLRAAALATRAAAAAAGGGEQNKRQQALSDGGQETVDEDGGGGGVGENDGVANAANMKAAKTKAASILQKHKLISSTSAVQAGTRGGLHVKGVVAKAGAKRLRTETTSPRAEPRPQATNGAGKFRKLHHADDAAATKASFEKPTNGQNVRVPTVTLAGEKREGGNVSLGDALSETDAPSLSHAFGGSDVKIGTTDGSVQPSSAASGIKLKGKEMPDENQRPQGIEVAAPSSSTSEGLRFSSGGQAQASSSIVDGAVTASESRDAELQQEQQHAADQGNAIGQSEVVSPGCPTTTTLLDLPTEKSNAAAAADCPGGKVDQDEGVATASSFEENPGGSVDSEAGVHGGDGSGSGAKGAEIEVISAGGNRCEDAVGGLVGS